MIPGERFEKDGKLYEVVRVFGNNFSSKEVKEEKLPEFVMPEVKEEAPKKKRVTRKKV